MRFAAREGHFLFVQPPLQLSDALVDALLAELEENLRCSEPYVLVFDLSNTGMPNALQRRKLAEHMAIHEAAIRRCVMGLVIVAPNAVVRGMVTALFWLVPPPIAHGMCGSRSEAIAWAQGLLPRTPSTRHRSGAVRG